MTDALPRGISGGRAEDLARSGRKPSGPSTSMSSATDDLTICVITPTYHREALLARFLGRIGRQRHRNWRLIVVHDGPNEETAALVARHRAADPRVECLQTRERSNNYGITPRLEGVRHLLGGGPGDYCVFWDDDNLFGPDALGSVARALASKGEPDLLLVGMRYQGRVLPPPGVPAGSLGPGQLDTGSLVVRPSIAAEAFEHVLGRNAGASPIAFYTQDFQFFDFVRSRTPGARIEVADGVVVGLHDGLRWKPRLRSLLGIPALGLKDRLGRLGGLARKPSK
jgi:glycosyltransferase involved in cell wall biosynthesis